MSVSEADMALKRNLRAKRHMSDATLAITLEKNSVAGAKLDAVTLAGFLNNYVRLRLQEPDYVV